MIFGSIDDSGDLTIPIRVLDANGHVHRIVAVVDTGFNGHISLLPHQIRELGLGPPQSVAMAVANDAIISVNAYPGIVLWQGERRPVEVIEAEGTPTVGLALLWGSLLTVEITEHGAVTISPLPSPAGSASAGSAPGGSPAPVSPE